MFSGLVTRAKAQLGEMYAFYNEGKVFEKFVTVATIVGIGIVTVGVISLLL